MTCRLPILLAIAITVLAGSVMACSVPVFRYAFEHWRPDPYRGIVFHRGELTEPQRALLAQLAPRSDDGRSLANLEIKTVDLDGEADATLTSLWEEQGAETLPWIVVQSPSKQGPPTNVWGGPLSDETLSNLNESPVRLELQNRLLGGHSVVWLFLGSGSQSEDDDAYQTLQAEIERLQQVLELPQIEEADLSELSLDPAALKLKMSTLRVARDDPSERFLVDMLLRVEPDLLEEPFVNQPMAFPVFGRGRALYALVGNGIAPDTIEEACRFLTGGCQCTVKAQNPGVDLLMAVDWDRYVQPALPYDTTPPTLTGLAGFATSEKPATNGSSDDQSSGTQVEENVVGNSADSRGESADDGDATVVAQGLRSTPDLATPTDATPGAKSRSSSSVGGVESAAPPTPSPSITGSLILVMGLLTICVIVASMVLIPRSR